jgi:hypothetical protein
MRKARGEEEVLLMYWNGFEDREKIILLSLQKKRIVDNVN